MSELHVVGIEIDLGANTLVLKLTDDATSPDTDTVPTDAVIDVGVGGRLIGVELSDSYVPVMEPEPGTEALVRSADVQVGVAHDRSSRQIRAITVPRGGAGYEITYPSGNQ